MKVLFLDIDGVLNSNRTAVAFNGYPHDFSERDMPMFDHVAVGLIRKLCQDTNSYIVLSSDWRRYFEIDIVAVSLQLPVIDATSQSSIFTSRGIEIQSWLNGHPEVTHYAIVDDIAQMLSSQKHNFVQTDPEVGLSLRDYLDLKHILLKESV